MDTDRACNTECPLYVQGICGYVDASQLTKPAEYYGFKDKTECPRYREQYPERVLISENITLQK